MRSLWMCSVAGCLTIEEGDPDVDPLALQPPEPSIDREWEVLTDVHPTMGHDLDLSEAIGVDPLIYAVLGDQIGRWNGAAWETITASTPGLSSFHRVSDTEIYAVREEEIQRWDGVAWLPLTDPVEGLQQSFVFQAATYVFATVVEPGRPPRIDLWNGTEWAPFTAELAGLTSFAARGDDLYAVVGAAVHRWDGISWQAVTPPAPGIGPALVTSSDRTFTVLRNNAIWRWADEEWYAVSDDPGEPIQPDLQLGPTGLVYAIVGQHVDRF